ncbi:MAG: hypothetical protein MZU97_05155 [Bacillus subtilis]|nr:hypothetical protein [Bacillus subtilis]
MIASLFPDFHRTARRPLLPRRSRPSSAALATFDGHTDHDHRPGKGHANARIKSPAISGCRIPKAITRPCVSLHQAEKFDRPILFIIDTPGAYPGIGAEERGQANAIAASPCARS